MDYLKFYKFCYNIIKNSRGNLKKIIKEKEELLKFIIE